MSFMYPQCYEKYCNTLNLLIFYKIQKSCQNYIHAIPYTIVILYHKTYDSYPNIRITQRNVKHKLIYSFLVRENKGHKATT